MTLPLVLMVGLLVALLGAPLQDALPGDGVPSRVVPAASLLLLPSALAFWSLRASRRELRTGQRSRVPPRAVLAWSAFATPATVHALFAVGAYQDFLERATWGSSASELLLRFLPVFVAELPRLVLATMAQIHLDVRAQAHELPMPEAMLPRLCDLAPYVRLRLGWPILIVGVFALVAGLDLLIAESALLQAFVHTTTLGHLASAIALLLLAVSGLPWLFRFAFGIHGRLPLHLRQPLYDVAERLGFAKHRLLVLPTGRRSLNAMLVGPLPFGRFVCLTDGLLEGLDAECLKGVVAHEVGHARMGHPAWLLALALSTTLVVMALVQVGTEAGWPMVLVGVLAALATVAGWLVVRRLAHRVELEADAASVQALGAGPCSQALLDVGRLAAPVAQSWWNRVFSLHPNETERAVRMHRYQADPAYRAEFDRRGRHLRIGVLAAVLVAPWLAWAAFLPAWPSERVMFTLAMGDVPGARAAIAEVPDVSTLRERSWRTTQNLVDAAAVLAPDARDWPTASAAFTARGWQRGEQELVTKGPAAAEPWFALYLAASTGPTDLERAVHAYCVVAVEEDPERMERLRVQVRRLGPPQALAAVFAE